MNKSVKLEIHSLCDPITRQLYGVLSDGRLSKFEADRKAIDRLYMSGYFGPTQCRKLRNKLIKKIKEEILKK